MYGDRSDMFMVVTADMSASDIFTLSLTFFCTGLLTTIVSGVMS